MTTPRLLSCVVVTLLTLSACSSGTSDEPPTGSASASGVVGTGPGSGGETGAPASGTPAPVELTSEAYRAELEKARGPVREAVRKVAATAKLKDLDKRLERASAAVNDAVAQLTPLTPPADVRAQHDEYVLALRRFAAAFDTARQDAQDQQVCTGPAVLTGMDKADELSGVEKAAGALAGYPAGVVSVKAAGQKTRRLSNGKFIHSEGRPGRAYLELKNGNGQDAVVVLMRGKKKAITVYVRKKSKFRVQGVRDGKYKVYYTLGTDWDSKARSFTRSCTFEQFGKSVRFRTVHTATQIRWTDWTITLNAVRGGTVRPKRVKPGDFPG
ncbi:hypothetical protein ACQPYK_16785 [Streptosporangium sp. CA-135522]|uniref:hypothetical protein n=1 Tax=Streptosporangium sp. CA-135522 TaxID=3240072 RepID=UPI003D8C6272